MTARRDFLRFAAISTVALAQDVWAVDTQSQPNQKEAKMNSRRFTFVAGDMGSWKIVDMQSIVGEALPDAYMLGKL